jgi:hypothetical protein
MDAEDGGALMLKRLLKVLARQHLVGIAGGEAVVFDGQERIDVAVLHVADGWHQAKSPGVTRRPNAIGLWLFRRII